MFKDKEQLQQKIIHLLLRYNDLVAIFVAHKIDINDFDPDYRVLIQAILVCHTKSCVLTKNLFEDFVTRSVNDGSYQKITGRKVDGPKTAVLKENRTFFNAFELDSADKNDFELFIKSLRETVARSKTTELFNLFQERSKTGKTDFYQSIAELSDGLQKLSTSATNDKFSMVFLDESSEGFLKTVKDERSNPKPRLSTGFPDLDKAIGTGLEPGTLTLFVADVGGFKSTMMMNIAMNIFRQFNENVLYVSLEMPEILLKKKMVARDTGLWFSKLINPQEMTDDEMKKLEEEMTKWNNSSHRYGILDTKDRLAVSDIRAAIESYITSFRPRAVFVDYISILAAEKSYARLNSHEWIGFMCKDLRQMGRKYGFAVISAAQLGREALKRLRAQKEGSQTVGSEDIRASHDFSADSDNIFALVPDPNEPNNKLQVFCVKARYGDKTFDGQGKVRLDVNRRCGRISSYEDASWTNSPASKDASIKHVEQVATNLSFDDNLDLDDFDTPKAAGSIKIESKDVEKEFVKKSTPAKGSFD